MQGADCGDGAVYFLSFLGPWATYVDESKVAKPSEVSSLKN